MATKTRERRSRGRSQERSESCSRSKDREQHRRKKVKKCKKTSSENRSRTRSPATGSPEGVRRVSVTPDPSSSPTKSPEHYSRVLEEEEPEQTPLRLEEAPANDKKPDKSWLRSEDDVDQEEIQCKVCYNWVKGGKAGMQMHCQYSKKHATYKLYNEGSYTWQQAQALANRQWKNQWRKETRSESVRSRSPVEVKSSGSKHDKTRSREEPKRREEKKKDDKSRPDKDKTKGDSQDKARRAPTVVAPKPKPPAQARQPEPVRRVDDSPTSLYSYYTTEDEAELSRAAVPAAPAAAKTGPMPKKILAAKPKSVAAPAQAPAPVTVPASASGPSRTESLAEFYENQAKFLRHFGN